MRNFNLGSSLKMARAPIYESLALRTCMGAMPEVLGFPKFWGTYWASPHKKVWGFILEFPIVEITIAAIIRIARLSTSSSLEDATLEEDSSRAS